ncbi:MAG: hypothetical protein A3H00_00170 [Candidatus Portnoybacteria bacterium RBG_13_40_8]|nr:MAG: hypothetical protein A3H00_00170 [Candidatus Portnoybacteria bacterium RBG_13_40_8]
MKPFSFSEAEEIAEITEFLESLRKDRRRIGNDFLTEIYKKYRVLVDSTELELPNNILARVIMGRKRED